MAAGLVERVVDTAAAADNAEVPDPPTPASTTESLGDEWSRSVSPAPGDASPHLV